MPVPKCISESVGSWTGDSTLHMSWMPEGQRIEKGPSRLHIDLAKDQSYAVASYKWTYKGETEEGHLILTSGEKETNIGWSDSWHQNTAVMLLSGKSADDVDCRGSYKVEGHPDWGWRVTFALDGKQLVFKMYNISPEGVEDLATEGYYNRS